MMKLELLLDKPKFTLMFPYKNQFNRAGGPFMISLSVMILWILKHLISYNTDFTDKIIIAIVLDLCSTSSMVYGVLSLHKWSKIRSS